MSRRLDDSVLPTLYRLRDLYDPYDPESEKIAMRDVFMESGGLGEFLRHGLYHLSVNVSFIGLYKRFVSGLVPLCPSPRLFRCSDETGSFRVPGWFPGPGRGGEEGGDGDGSDTDLLQIPRTK